MPVVNIKIREGRSVEQKRALAKKVTEALVESIGARPEAVTISIEDIKRENMASGGVLYTDK